MSGHHAHAHHHDHGPLESITHVHGGAMVLDIGGSVGALHVLVDDAWVGRELFLATDDPAFSVHTGVWLRHASRGRATSRSALFAALEEGTLPRARRRRRAPSPRRACAGGEVTEIDLTAR